MINANELRIGNIIRHTNGNGVFDCPVSLLHRDGGIAIRPPRGGEWGMLEEDYEGIPLTEEVLLKFGFELKNQWFDYELDNMRIGYITNDEFFQFEGGGIIDIKHLHQLQNLYFALTGKELVYTP